MISYRKTKAGRWAVMGPADEVRLGAVEVNTRSGRIRVKTVESLGQPFAVDGIEHVYGYLRSRAERTPRVCAGNPCRCYGMETWDDCVRAA